MAPTLKDMATWSGSTGHDGLRAFTDQEDHFWIKQNALKKTKWAKLKRDGHDVAWELVSTL